ncbi:hypothetical protein OESDEN_04953 [Oesophagostomum dentatum]|uniref:Uncharacterized protein n=1 Tax=Oesophagostomum dentatum TaxID=61180 RepID=A0A0B1TCV9_OESDE|nr:hypothetical protein OESDEN_04953 [Oesophagostomum dentatum]
MSTGETISSVNTTDTMDSDPDYKSLLSKLEREYRITINEFLGKSHVKTAFLEEEAPDKTVTM